MSVLTCENVSFEYEGRTVLSHINFSIDRGDYLCVIGENGAGKSTLLKGILGLKKCATGSIFEGDGFQTNGIGYLPQQTIIQRDFPASVYEIVRSGRLNQKGLNPFYNRKDKDVVMNNLKLLGIEGLRQKCYRELSGGQQQRVLLARALCAGSTLLALDEPVAGLDPVMTEDLYQIVAKINREEKRTILMISHDISNVIKYASHILQLGKEQLFFGTKEEYVISSIGRKLMGGEEYAI